VIGNEKPPSESLVVFAFFRHFSNMRFGKALASFETVRMTGLRFPVS